MEAIESLCPFDDRTPDRLVFQDVTEASAYQTMVRRLPERRGAALPPSRPAPPPRVSMARAGRLDPGPDGPWRLVEERDRDRHLQPRDAARRGARGGARGGAHSMTIRRAGVVPVWSCRGLCDANPHHCVRLVLVGVILHDSSVSIASGHARPRPRRRRSCRGSPTPSARRGRRSTKPAAVRRV